MHVGAARLCQLLILRISSIARPEGIAQRYLPLSCARAAVRTGSGRPTLERDGCVASLVHSAVVSAAEQELLGQFSQGKHKVMKL